MYVEQNLENCESERGKEKKTRESLVESKREMV